MTQTQSFETPSAKSKIWDSIFKTKVIHWLCLCQHQETERWSYEFTQHTLINSIIEDIGIKDAKVKPVPVKVSQRLHAFKDEPSFGLDFNFNYRSEVGKLNYVAKTTRPNIMYGTHQTAKYSLDPRDSHFSIWFATWRKLAKCWAWSHERFRTIVTPISLDFGTRSLCQWTPVQPSHKVDWLSSSMQDALFPGLPNFNLKLRSLLLRPNTWLCHKHYMCLLCTALTPSLRWLCQTWFP